MVLSSTQLRIAQDWIEQYVGRHCPCCGYTSLHLNKTLMTLLQAPEKDQELDGDMATHVVTLTCGVCANVRMFSAKAMGVISDQRVPVAARVPQAAI